ncbi:HD domain-containing protein [Candidatus Micrarchaeota archaeon]|jgi:hypothetical protein|nr:HD domain-containing protein [Candidatus Micrarchaeota archaeon]
MKLFEPLYQLKIQPTEVECKIINSYWFQRLKYIHHAGVDFTHTYKTHTRYQHSIGVYALATKFYKENHMMRVAALLHDVGHLPFSHAVEDAYGYKNNKSIHHEFTKHIILKTEISDILRYEALPPRLILDFIEGKFKSPIKPLTNILGLDLFDCFIRDTFYSGTLKIKPSKLINQINAIDDGITCDAKTAMKIHRVILKDHEQVFSSYALIRNGLVQRLFKLVVDKIGTSEKIYEYTEYEIMAEIFNIAKHDKKIKDILNHLLYVNDYKVSFKPKIFEEDVLDQDIIKYSVKKVYPKTVFVDGRPYSDINEKVKSQLKSLDKYIGTYYISENQNEGKIFKCINKK